MTEVVGVDPHLINGILMVVGTLFGVLVLHLCLMVVAVNRLAQIIRVLESDDDQSSGFGGLQ